jgi:DNA-directed RNA polymerase specialized sigma24 family protein
VTCEREAPTITGTETWTSHECAAAWGVKTPTWLGYVARGQAPQPLPGHDEKRRRRWDAEAVRSFPRPGVGRARAGAGAEAVTLLEEMADVAARIDELRARQRELARAGKAEGVEIRAMARALGVSPQTVYGWLGTE